MHVGPQAIRAEVSPPPAGPRIHTRLPRAHRSRATRSSARRVDAGCKLRLSARADWLRFRSAHLRISAVHPRAAEGAEGPPAGPLVRTASGRAHGVLEHSCVRSPTGIPQPSRAVLPACAPGTPMALAWNAILPRPHRHSQVFGGGVVLYFHGTRRRRRRRRRNLRRFRQTLHSVGISRRHERIPPHAMRTHVRACVRSLERAEASG
jgi:hypothetical protein